MPVDHLYRQLQQHLDQGPVGFPATESGVEIRILRHLFTPEEAGIALELSAIPEPLAVVYKRLKSKMSLTDCTRALEQMAGKGLIHGIPIRGKKHYGKMIFAIGMYERQINHLTPEFEKDAREYIHGAFAEAFHSKTTTQLRVVPVNQSIAVEHNVATYDDIREYVRRSDGPFAKMNCICRQGNDLHQENCKQTHLRENCLTLGMAAETMVGHGAARFISKEEMLQLLDEADKEGLVLQPENTKAPLFVCCCCGCCCGVLGSAKRFPRPAEYFSASFRAEVDAGDCSSCWMCRERCQMEAILDVDGRSQVDEARCIGCALCVTTCPSGALKLKPVAALKIPPDDTRALYITLLRERYGPLGLASVGGRKLLGMKF
jgi:Pyruvate/2-oxoacid:ferredoxin oxidoreductase delta subunit